MLGRGEPVCTALICRDGQGHILTSYHLLKPEPHLRTLKMDLAAMKAVTRSPCSLPGGVTLNISPFPAFRCGLPDLFRAEPSPLTIMVTSCVTSRLGSQGPALTVHCLQPHKRI